MSQAAIPQAPSAAPLLPRSIRRALRQVDARLRTSASVRGMGTALLVVAVGACLGMAADFAWTLPPAARWATWGAWVAALVLVAIGWIVRPMVRKARWIDLAAVAERVDPRLGERLTGSIALLDDREGHANGSPALIAALTEDAAGHAGSFDSSLVHGKGQPARRLILGALAVALVAAPAFVRPDPFRTLALRFLAPWMDLERIGWLTLTVSPGDKIAAVGSELKVEARVAPRYGSTAPPETASLEWTDEKGEAHRVRMAVQPPESTSSGRSFEITLPRLVGSISYRVSTVGTRSRAYRVTAVEPPTIIAFSARVEPPSYTKLPSSMAKDPSRIEALEGSRILLMMATRSPVKTIDLTWPSGPPTGKTGSRSIKLEPTGDGKHATASVDAEATGPFVLTPLRDEYGLDGLPETRQIVVRADAPPTLAVKGPAAASQAKPDDLLQVAIAARDDFAVASAEIHYEVRRARTGDDTQPGHIALKLDGLGSPVARGVGTLSLRDLSLEVGDAVAYRVMVTDNRPAPRGPNVVWSDAHAIAIVASAEPLMAKEDRVRRESFQSRLDDIRKANTSNRRETEQLRYSADAAQKQGSAWDAAQAANLNTREVEARSIEDKLQLLARDLENDVTFEPLARPTRQAAEVEAEAGRAQLDQARRAPDASKRLADLRQADARLGALGNRLDEIRRKFDELAKLDTDRQKLRELAAREDALATKAAEGPADKNKIAAEQDDLRKALDALLAQSPGLRAGLLAAQAEEAARLAKEARALAEKQRAEARKTTEIPHADAALREIAKAQKELEDDARRLALEVDEPLAENGRARLDADSLNRPVAPIERGELPDAVRRLEEAEEGLRRLTRDVEDVPADPKALARRLARRQEALANDLTAVQGEARRKDIPPDEQAALAVRTRPLAEKEEEIARLTAGIVAPEPQKAIAREAVQATDRARENLRALKPRESENAQNAAKKALNQLADALPDPNRLRDESRRKIDEAKRKEEEVLREIDRQIAETRPQPDKPDADAKAATDLAEKIAPLVQKQKENAELLANLVVEPRLRPQRDRAAARAARLADQIQAVKEQAPPRRAEPKPKPPAQWHVAGPFPGLKANLPFDPAKPINLDAPVKGADGKTTQPWKPVPPEGEEGKIDLGRIFNKNDNQTAFGVAEITSPTRRKAQLSIGSDDNLTVWVNGKQVFEYGGSRGFSPGQDKAEVELVEGVNRVVIRCGNGNSEWQFAVNATPPPPDGFDPEKARRLRETLASAKVDAQASLYRLEQKSNGRMPADDLAEILAAEQHAAADKMAEQKARPAEDDPAPREQATLDRKRIATALRNLPVAEEVPALQAEAVRLADEAARPEADPKAVQAAAEAADALAERLGDGLAPRELAAALARAERALDTPEAQADPAQVADRQKAIAAEMTHPAVPPTDQPPANAPPASATSEKAGQAVRRATDLAERANRPDPGNPSKPAPAPADVASARAQAAEALEKMAADPALGPDPAAAAAEAPKVAEGGNKPPGDANKAPAEPGKPNAPAGAEMAGGPADPDLGLGPDQAARAADLARRQRQVRERLQAVMADRVGPQQDLRREARALGRDLADLRDRAKEINARAQWQANAAAEHVGEHAPRAMDKGTEQLAQGRLDQARDNQRQAADFIEQAARAAEDFAAGLRAEGPGEAGEAAAAATSGLGEARESLRDVARQLAQAPEGQGSQAAKAASPAMHEAAEALRTAAQTSGTDPSAPPTGEPSPDNPNPKSTAAGVADADLSALQDLVRKKTGRQWGELPGHLRTEILQLSKGRYRDDYARLIQLYFREIATDAGKSAKP